MRFINGLIAWFVATLYVVYSFTLNTAAGVFASKIQSSLHINQVQATVAVTVFIIGFALMQIPAGYLLDRFKSRYVVTAGILVLALGNLLTSFAGNLLVFCISNFIQGVGASFAFVAAGVLIGQWFKPKVFPILFGLTQTISCILSGVLHYYLAIWLKSYSWNDLYFLIFIFGAILVVVSAIFVRNPPEFKPPTDLSLGKSLKTVCSKPQLWLCTIAAGVSFGVLLSYAGLWYLPIQEHWRMSLEQSMIISAFIFGGIGIGTPLAGWISNAVKSRKKVIHVFLTLGIIFFLSGIYLPKFDMGSLAVIKTVSFLIGLLLSGSMLFYTVVSEILPLSVKGVALSVTNTGVFIFNSLMMFIPYIFTASKIYFTTLWILPAFALISLLLLPFIRESYQD